MADAAADLLMLIAMRYDFTLQVLAIANEHALRHPELGTVWMMIERYT